MVFLCACAVAAPQSRAEVQLSGSVRNPAVAGRFYPAEPDALKEQIAALLGQAKPFDAFPKAVIAPHAGYRYSGPVAATVFISLEGMRGAVKRVLLLGPSHRAAFTGLGISHAEFFATPLGRLRVDRETVTRLSQLDGVSFQDKAHEGEHSLEAEMPFIQTVFGEVDIVPILVGQVNPQAAGDLLISLWGGPETLIIVSSDLSHYLAPEAARKADAATAAAIERLDAAAIAPDNACGYLPVQVLLHAAKKLGYAAKTADLRNSGDTSGETVKVVGYGAFFFEPADPANAKARREQVLNRRRAALYGPLIHRIARESIVYGFKNGKALPVKLSALPEDLQSPGAAFVTLTEEGALCGCIGTLASATPLGQDIANNAFNAAFRDGRFKPLTEDRFENVKASIQLIDPPEPLPFTDAKDLLAKIRPEDGHIIESPGHRGTLLPGMWEKGMSAAAFMRRLMTKAGIQGAQIPNGTRMQRYSTTPVSP